MPKSAAEILADAKQENVHFLRLQFTDIDGIIKNVEVPESQFSKALDGQILFDGSSIEGFTRIEESDMLLVPDLVTFQIFPWETDHGKVGRLICDIATPDGSTFAGCPRSVLKRVVERARDMGYTMMAGPEHLMAVEAAYLKAVQATRACRLADGKLELFDGTGAKRLVFGRDMAGLEIIEPGAPLYLEDGMLWVPMRSLAVDRTQMTFHAPVWVDAPGVAEAAGLETAFRRLMVAQDTGSAIVGAARGDLYFGTGDDAGARAGRIRHGATFTALVPRPI